MNIRLIAIYTLIVAFTHQPICYAKNDKNERIEIKSNILKLADGNGWMKIKEMLVAVAQLQEIQGYTKKNVIECDGAKYNLRELAIHETGTRSGVLHTPIVNKRALDLATQKVKAASELWIDLKTYKQQIASVIKQWSVQRKKTDTLLVKWGEEEENQFIKNHITSCTTLTHFVDDLIVLILDIKQSCPITSAKFDQQYKKKTAKT